jgi:hypothetical protein
MYISTTKTKQITRATEMETLRAITCQVTRAHSERVRETLEVQDVVRWTRSRRRQWRDDVERMGDERLAKKFQTQKHKRWYDSWTVRDNNP